MSFAPVIFSVRAFLCVPGYNGYAKGTIFDVQLVNRQK